MLLRLLHAWKPGYSRLDFAMHIIRYNCFVIKLKQKQELILVDQPRPQRFDVLVADTHTWEMRKLSGERLEETVFKVADLHNDMLI